jgi:hypothetical protein
VFAPLRGMHVVSPPQAWEWAAVTGTDFSPWSVPRFPMPPQVSLGERDSLSHTHGVSPLPIFLQMGEDTEGGNDDSPVGWRMLEPEEYSESIVGRGGLILCTLRFFQIRGEQVFSLSPMSIRLM